MSKSGPMMHSYQGALPHLPLPSLNDTIGKHLLSMRPILNDEEFEDLEHLSEVFRKGLGRRLQRYLQLKSWLSTNYVTDWWEEFVYMRQRSPIMINSNYYGFDTLNEHPTHNQAARAANVTFTALLFRRQVERQEVTPVSGCFVFMIRYCILMCLLVLCLPTYKSAILYNAVRTAFQQLPSTRRGGKRLVIN
ncbi:unnamed protein product [Cylicostephanus goldi]|uniref:Choline/carnitine acyltransferase domain-containing protein n=1 Tax=Cylicostephanus goldi TaxID=71465 RepID=A0A3P6S269_CYLGO|nr:unnamed protein product [Cylicostephanus goldi]